MLDPQHAQHVLTQHRSLHAGAGSALVESTADNAGATLGISWGMKDIWFSGLTTAIYFNAQVTKKWACLRDLKGLVAFQSCIKV